MGSLITELLTIHDGNYVVRALVQMGGTTLATGMAASTTLELAEDQARLRVLQVMGLSPNGEPERSSPAQLSAYGVQVHWTGQQGDMPDLSALRFGSSQPHQPPAIASSPASSVSLPPSAPIPTVEARNADLPRPQVEATPAAPSISYPYAGLAPDESELINPPLSPPPQPAPQPVPAQPSPHPSVVPSQSAELDVPDDLDLDFDDNWEPSPPIPEPPAPEPEESSPIQRQPSPNPEPEPTIVVDRSDEIAQIDVEMRRLGWTKIQGRTYLQNTYGKRSRQQLTDQELLEFLEFLASQPSPSEAPF